MSSTNFQNQPGGQGELCEQDGGHAQGEFDVLGLVAEGVHAQQGTHAAAQGGGEHQGPLADAPAVFLGLDLVHKHKDECGGID